MFEPRKEYQNSYYWDGRSSELSNQNLSFSDKLNIYIIERKIKVINSFIEEYKPKTVLDAGCGVGSVLIPLTKKYPNIHFYAVDFSEKNIKQIPSLYNIQVFKSVVWDLSFKDKEIDFLFSLDVLYHLTSNQKRLTLNEYNRISKRYCCNFRGEEFTTLFNYEFMFRKLRIPLFRDKIILFFTKRNDNQLDIISLKNKGVNGNDT